MGTRWLLVQEQSEALSLEEEPKLKLHLVTPLDQHSAHLVDSDQRLGVV